MRNLKQKLPGFWFSLPSLVLTLIFSVYPIGWAMRYMFYDYKGYGTERFVGLDNFVRLLSDEAYWNSVVNTFVYAGGKLAITLPLSLILAVILNRGIRGKGFLRGVYFLPTIISASVMSVVFFTVFNSYNGVLNQLLVRYGIVERNVDWLGVDKAMLTVILIAAWGAIGNYMLLLIAGLQSIPDDIYESASLDGANAWQKFIYVTIPMLGPVLQMVIMLAIINSLKGYESIMVLTEGGPIGKTEVMFMYVYKLFFPISTSSNSMEQQLGYGSAVGFVTAIIVGVVTLFYFRLSKRLNQVH
ncbi:carbohydrate ABC transporter permease [Paenibacillus wynnii]|uniref:carbohydrate ABC transporter permease n=1 Tax=Paenibacillus wynnii TaxID=268407 RepID=UPI0027924ED3|nr:sugar ABC transporter permease [Paenibacillus wynnii]MDQ0191745.1 ABC-type sugar transport system permease subunit [Paenibacillus wynnii]